MIRTMIVDDEVWVCTLICNIVDWSNYGYTIIKRAYSGNEALEAIMDLKPDLIFTDIRMPGMDGLALIREVEKLGLDTKFIIISGYSDFEYAKTAIESGVLGYLVKPVEPDELSALLAKLQKNVFSSNQKQIKALLHEQLNKSRQQCHEQFMYNFLLVNPRLDENFRLASFNQEFNTYYQDGLFQVFSLVLDKKDFTSYSVFKTEFFQNITEKWYQYFKAHCFEVCVIRSAMSVICIVNYAKTDRQKIRVIAEDFFHECRNHVSKTPGYSITAGVGAPVMQFTDLAQSFAAAQNCIRARITLGTGQMIDLTKKIPACDESAAVLSGKGKNLLFQYINCTCELSAEDVINTIFFENGNLSNDPVTLFKLVSQFVYAFYSVLNMVNINFEEICPISQVEKEVESLYSIDQLKNYLANLLQNGQLQNTSVQNKGSSAIKVLQSYIETNFNQEITLKDLSDQVYLNPKYICELFKKEIGMNFNDYLTQKRIEKAKLYLMNPCNRISEISAMVGYNDNKYFSRLFKKIVGVNPSQFRKLHS